MNEKHGPYDFVPKIWTDAIMEEVYLRLGDYSTGFTRKTTLLEAVESAVDRMVNQELISLCTGEMK